MLSSFTRLLLGTVVHLECLYRRRLGTPIWEVNSYAGRTYPQASREAKRSEARERVRGGDGELGRERLHSHGP